MSDSSSLDRALSLSFASVGLTDVAALPVISEPQEIAARLRAGDVRALELVYRQHHEAVRAFARRLLGDRELAEDLVQDVFLAAPAALGGYRGESALRTFLLGIAVNQAKQYVRSATRRRRFMDKVAVESAQPGPPRPDEHCERHELASTLVRALDELPLDERIAVVLFEVEGRTSGEVAEIVGAAEATVRTRLSRARKRLRAILGDNQ